MCSFNQIEKDLTYRFIRGHLKSQVFFYNLVISIFHEVLYLFMNKHKQLIIYSNNRPIHGKLTN